MKKHPRLIRAGVEELESRTLLSAAGLHHASAGAARHANPSSGFATFAFDEGLKSVLNNAKAWYQGTQTGSNGEVHSEQIVADITRLIQDIDAEDAIIESFLGRPNAKITLGVTDGKKVTLSGKDLASLDQVVLNAAEAFNNGNGESSNPRDGINEVAFLQSVADSITHDAPAAIIKGGEQARQAFTEAAGGVNSSSGAATYLAITELTFGMALAVEAGSKQIIAQNTDLHVSSENQSAQFLVESLPDRLGKDISTLIQVAKGAARNLPAVINDIKYVYGNLKKDLDRSNAGSVISEINQLLSFKPAPPTPTPTLPTRPTPTPTLPVSNSPLPVAPIFYLPVAPPIYVHPPIVLPPLWPPFAPNPTPTNPTPVAATNTVKYSYYENLYIDGYHQGTGGPYSTLAEANAEVQKDLETFNTPVGYQTYDRWTVTREGTDGSVSVINSGPFARQT